MSSSDCLQKLVHIQGGLCFFCKKPLPAHKATVEHLVATANGGKNVDDNRVACCKSMNQLLASKPLKEKLEIILSLNGQCPNKASKPKKQDEKFDAIIAALAALGNAKPKRIQALKNTVAKTFDNELTDSEIRSLIDHLISTGRVAILENKLVYRF